MRKIFGFIALCAICMIMGCGKTTNKTNVNSDSITADSSVSYFDVTYDTAHKWAVYAITEDEQELELMDTVSNFYVERTEEDGIHLLYIYYNTDSYLNINYCFRYKDCEDFDKSKTKMNGELDNIINNDFCSSDSVLFEFDKHSKYINVGCDTIRSNFSITFVNDMKLIFKLVK